MGASASGSQVGPPWPDSLAHATVKNSVEPGQPFSAGTGKSNRSLNCLAFDFMFSKGNLGFVFIAMFMTLNQELACPVLLLPALSSFLSFWF